MMGNDFKRFSKDHGVNLMSVAMLCGLITLILYIITNPAQKSNLLNTNTTIGVFSILGPSMYLINCYKEGFNPFKIFTLKQLIIDLMIIVCAFFAISYVYTYNVGVKTLPTIYLNIYLVMLVIGSVLGVSALIIDIRSLSFSKEEIMKAAHSNFTGMIYSSFLISLFYILFYASHNNMFLINFLSLLAIVFFAYLISLNLYYKHLLKVNIIDFTSKVNSVNSSMLILSFINLVTYALLSFHVLVDINFVSLVIAIVSIITTITFTIINNGKYLDEKELVV